ncbi:MULTISPECIES: hypothetical protein [Nostoc]|uniref:Uncharacterized protein n=1 Tax=Nostoc paludosum FACHB-159 TaxID=2692908 RepID=A0ABR8KBU8_9NOSO|nr:MULTISPECIES: hypothetical protein [Nostoc]MBD2680618.1 hypothetical protein [Nostoc sp. FACHB-857]MBD2737012.1 hypothetical protein [Nostoc paludosum FACHB-159]
MSIELSDRAQLVAETKQVSVPYLEPFFGESIRPALKIGHWALGIGHWALSIGHEKIDFYCSL